MASFSAGSNDDGFFGFTDFSDFGRANRLPEDYYDENVASELLCEAHQSLIDQHTVQKIAAERRAYRTYQEQWLVNASYVLRNRYTHGECIINDLVLSSLGIKVLPSLAMEDLESVARDDLFFQPFKFTGAAITPLPPAYMAAQRAKDKQIWSRPTRSATFPDFVKDALDPWADLYGAPNLDKLWQVPCKGECATSTLEQLEATRYSHPYLSCGLGSQTLGVYCAAKRVEWFLASFRHLDGFAKDSPWSCGWCLCHSEYCRPRCIARHFSAIYGGSEKRNQYRSVAFFSPHDGYSDEEPTVPHTGVIVCNSTVPQSSEMLCADLILAVTVLDYLLERDIFSAHHTLPVIVFSFEHDVKANVLQVHLTGHQLTIRQLRVFHFDGRTPGEGAYELLRWMANTPSGQTRF